MSYLQQTQYWIWSLDPDGPAPISRGALPQAKLISLPGDADRHNWTDADNLLRVAVYHSAYPDKLRVGSRIYDTVVSYSFDETRQPAPPSLSHPLGTDPLGRGILSQLMYSARSEFLLGLLAAVPFPTTSATTTNIHRSPTQETDTW